MKLKTTHRIIFTSTNAVSGDLNNLCKLFPSVPFFLPLIHFGSSGVRALPLAAGINEGGHYLRYFGPSGVRALPLADCTNEGCHYFRYFWSERVACASGAT